MTSLLFTSYNLEAVWITGRDLYSNCKVDMISDRSAIIMESQFDKITARFWQVVYHLCYLRSQPLAWEKIKSYLQENRMLNITQLKLKRMNFNAIRFNKFANVFWQNQIHKNIYIKCGIFEYFILKQSKVKAIQNEIRNFSITYKPNV